MASRSPYIIGVDTGGTYTDAVLVDAASRTVIAAAKRPTTHHDLSVGMEQAMRAVLAPEARVPGAHPVSALIIGAAPDGTTERAQSLHADVAAAWLLPDGSVDPAAVRKVSVSTTLATNAVVEDGGDSAVGLCIIGWGNRVEVPGAAAIRHIPGGHRIDGTEQEPLALEPLLDAVASMKGRVDAYAVCSLMSFANPAHELVAARAISMLDKSPVFCSHEVSCRAGMQERAATAVLNARLLPVMRGFLDGMNEAMRRLGLAAEVVVVRGDATVMPLEAALRNAASTVASGPAATAVFGAGVTRGDALIVDVGGTTTDVTLLRNGKPVLAADGMVVGDWVTHVEAVEMFTVGIGGDSLVRLAQDGAIHVGPQRVMPLCMAGDLPDPGGPEGWIGAGRRSRCLVPVTAGKGAQEGNRVLDLLRARGAMPPGAVMRELGMAEITLEQEVAALVRRQALCEAGFTPTDALHVLGLLDFGDTAAARAGAVALGRALGCDAEAAARRVVASTRSRIEDAVVAHVASREVGGNLASYLAHRREHALLRIDVSLNVPVVGIGAAARHLLPGVAEALHTDMHFPERYDVGNALGAVFLALDSETA